MVTLNNYLLRGFNMGVKNKEYYNMHSNTEKTYKYIINEIFDKDSSISIYKKLKANPEREEYEYIASEIYTFFLTHYFKALDVLTVNKELLQLDSEHNEINIIDIGANIGTVTFACIDYLISGNEALDISINIIFIEVNKDRVSLLEKAIKKYIKETNLNIKYRIIPKKYEESIEDICESLVETDTIILISNLLKWISDIEVFRERLFDNIKFIKSEYQCNVINIETTSQNAHNKLIDLYHRISRENSDIKNKYTQKRMPRFNNIKGCYYYDQEGVLKFNRSYEYYYGYIINDSDLYKTKNLDYIKKAYYKSLYTARSYFLFDQLEIKYTNSNLDNVIRFIQNNIENNSSKDAVEVHYWEG